MSMIALVGDYKPDVIAHRAIPRAIELAAAGDVVSYKWVPTRDIRDAWRDLASFGAVWLVPASPYENMAGALAAVQFARETGRPFLGTCGGFQHAVLEIARNVVGLADAAHAETDPNAPTPVVTRLSCSLVEQRHALHFTAGSLIQQAYGTNTAVEGYHCNYGVNATFRTQLESAGLSFTAFDDEGAIRGAELGPTRHPFFVGTLFQPERAALENRRPRLVRAFIAATREQDTR